MYVDGTILLVGELNLPSLQVKVIGVVRNISTTATNVSYQVEDGTGTVDCRLWLDTSTDDSGKTDGIE